MTQPADPRSFLYRDSLDPDTAARLTAEALGKAEDGELYSTLCSGTRSLDVAPVPAAFGQGHPPAPGSSPVGRPDDQTPVLPLVAAEGVLVLTVVAVGSRVARARGAHSSLPTG